MKQWLSDVSLTTLSLMHKCNEVTYLDAKKDDGLDALELLLDLGDVHGELCLGVVDLCLRQVQFSGSCAQCLGVLFYVMSGQDGGDVRCVIRKMN